MPFIAPTHTLGNAISTTYCCLRLDRFDCFYVSPRLQFSFSNEKSSPDVAAMEVLQVLEVRVKVNKVDRDGDEKPREDDDEHGQSLLGSRHIFPQRRWGGR